MTRPVSLDVRVRVAHYVLAGHSRRDAAKAFGVSASSASRYVALFLATGEVTPGKPGGDSRGKLAAHGDFILQRVAAVPDITMPQLAAELAARGVAIHPSNLSRFLVARAWTFEKGAGRRRPAFRPETQPKSLAS